MLDSNNISGRIFINYFLFSSLLFSNPNAKTIEQELFHAICRAGGVSQANSESIKKVGWTRAARTDKGVHAIGQIVALKISIMEVESDMDIDEGANRGFSILVMFTTMCVFLSADMNCFFYFLFHMIIEDPKILEKINHHLPKDIQVFAIRRVNQGFNPKTICDGRVYEYFMPTYLFQRANCETTNDLAIPTGSWDIEQFCQSLAFDENDQLNNRSRLNDQDEDDVDDEEEEGLEDHEERLLSPPPRDITRLSESISTGNLEKQKTMDPSGILNYPPIPEIDNSSSENSAIEHDGSIQPGKRQKLLTSVVTELPSEKPIIDQSVRESLLFNDDHSNQNDLDDRDGSLQTDKEVSGNDYESFLSSYRISQLELDRLGSLLNNYVGSHNFHNYTSRRTFEQQSSRRVIHSFTIGTPQLIDNLEWISLTVQGQSFMLHQIRKMIGLAILLMRCGNPDLDSLIISRSFLKTRWSIPKAPGIGLMLNQVLLDFYNRRFTGGRDGSLAQRIDLDEMRSSIDNFKQAHIYRRIVVEEHHHRVFAQWLPSLVFHLDREQAHPQP